MVAALLGDYMKITDLPEQERPREKLLQRGTAALSNSEILAILLRHGTKQHSAIEIAQQLLQQFGSLRNILNAAYQDFCAIKGLGQTHYVQLQAAFALSQRILEQDLSTKFKFEDFKSLEKFLLSKLSLQTREIFAVIFLNTKMEFIAYEELFYGTLHHANVHPRELIKRVLANNAAALILAHNHPSGDPTPSRDDHMLTEMLQDSLKWLDVKIIQHIIVGARRCETILA
ncbi:MAG: repair protein RadC [Gammaproteobacteria bacterium]|jgi:DNA repair protein RadC|nr:repair protein RadC [Gammaproteobacteria bacterium]